MLLSMRLKGMLVMATKSFQTDFKFTSKTASALANALQQSKRVDVEVTQRVRHYSSTDLSKTTKFDSFFGSGHERTKVGP